MSMVELGISGWTYKGWRGTFYAPPKNFKVAAESGKKASY